MFLLYPFQPERLFVALKFPYIGFCPSEEIGKVAIMKRIGFVLFLPFLQSILADCFRQVIAHHALLFVDGYQRLIDQAQQQLPYLWHGADLLAHTWAADCHGGFQGPATGKDRETIQ